MNTKKLLSIAALVGIVAVAGFHVAQAQSTRTAQAQALSMRQAGPGLVPGMKLFQAGATRTGISVDVHKVPGLGNALLVIVTSDASAPEYAVPSASRSSLVLNGYSAQFQTTPHGGLVAVIPAGISNFPLYPAGDAVAGEIQDAGGSILLGVGALNVTAF